MVPKIVRRLGARIGRRQSEDRQAGLARDGLGEPDRRAAADRNETVGLLFARGRKAGIRDRLRHVHDRLRVQSAERDAEKIGNLLAEPRAAARRRHHKRAGR